MRCFLHYKKLLPLDPTAPNTSLIPGARPTQGDNHALTRHHGQQQVFDGSLLPVGHALEAVEGVEIDEVGAVKRFNDWQQTSV